MTEVSSVGVIACCLQWAGESTHDVADIAVRTSQPNDVFLYYVVNLVRLQSVNRNELSRRRKTSGRRSVPIDLDF